MRDNRTLGIIACGLLWLALLGPRAAVAQAGLPALPADTAAPAQEPAADEPASPDASEVVEESAPSGSEATEAVEPIDEGAPRGARQSLESAIAWSKEGIEHYRGQRYDKALESLRDAKIMLLQADLPEILQERGLAVLDCALESDMGKLDLEAVLHELEGRVLGSDSELDNRVYVEREARRILALFGDSTPNPQSLGTFVDEIERYVVFFSGKQRDFYERAYVRRMKYWPVIASIFAEKKIPLEQGFMAMVESGFNPLARSHADARGLWQFIPGTGRRYGLERNDDFYDVVKSTNAAGEYLLDLIGIFGSRSFLLATAAYNAGEGRVMNCLRRLEDPFGDRSFWEIRECFAPETREYVPRIFAAAIIATDPKRFGFDLPTPEELDERYDVVVIPNPTRLATLAARIGVTEADLRVSNTDLASSATRTPVRNFPLFVPAGQGAVLIAALESGELPAAPSIAIADVETPAGGSSQYRVRGGDTLSGISQKFKVSVTDLKLWNPELRGRSLLRGETIAIPGSGRSSSGGSASARTRSLTYTVKAGNSIQTVANLFAVRLSDIVEWNSLPSGAVKAGQKLKIHPPKALREIHHTVRRGDTPGAIARRYGVPVANVLTANGLGARTVIRPGQTLVVYAR
jgi:membrane-bound lytic murein transglycosylase D